MTTEVSKAQAEKISQEIKKAVEEILAANGLSAPTIRSKYGEWYEIKITASAVEVGENGVNLASPEATYFTKFGWSSFDGGRPVELTAPLGTKFANSQGEYAFAGIDPKKKKNPIVARRLSDGAKVFFPEGIVSFLNSVAK
jgi:hypothetical protein